ncbi:MAG: phasin family protein [Roseibium sp.]|nr:phasin family protein [Roseibium sp.]
MNLRADKTGNQELAVQNVHRPGGNRTRPYGLKHEEALMSDKSRYNLFDVPSFMNEWQQKALSNWNLAEREDKIEERTFANMRRVHQTIWDQAEKAFDDHMAFVSHRLHEDFECAKTLGQCRMPDEAIATLQAFYTKMAEEYQTYAKQRMERLQEGLTDSIAAAEDLNEAAIQTAQDLGELAEETFEDVSPSAKRKSTRKQPAVSKA